MRIAENTWCKRGERHLRKEQSTYLLAALVRFAKSVAVMEQPMITHLTDDFNFR